jgi:hypothetical protein
MPVACLCATLMPGSARNHERAQRLNASPFAKEIKGKIEEFFEVATMRCRPNALGGSARKTFHEGFARDVANRRRLVDAALAVA